MSHKHLGEQATFGVKVKWFTFCFVLFFAEMLEDSTEKDVEFFFPPEYEVA